jgi:hypothetical protein
VARGTFQQSRATLLSAEFIEDRNEPERNEQQSIMQVCNGRKCRGGMHAPEIRDFEPTNWGSVGGLVVTCVQMCVS